MQQVRKRRIERKTRERQEKGKKMYIQISRKEKERKTKERNREKEKIYVQLR